MKIFGKYTLIAGISLLLFLGLSTQAATGDTTTTGNVNTGTTNSGDIVTFTGSLITYLNTQESSVSALLTTVYGQLYTTFIKTGLNILKSIDYQSLVCLGALQDVSLLSQMQKDKTSLMTAFKQDFISLESQVLSLEEKQALQESDNVNMFDIGTTYESEKAKLKDLIDAKVKMHKGFITSYASTYASKNTEFLTTYLQYRTANADFLNTIQSKIAKVQSVLAAFSGVEAAVVAINAKVTGLDDLMQKIEESKTKGLANLQSTLQTLIDTNIKKYKKLQNLSNELTQQKTYVIGQYQNDLNTYLNTSLQNRYNRNQYLALKAEVNAFKAKFYTATNQLNCSNILSTTAESTGLSAKITTMSIAVNSGLVKITTEGISSAFKDQLYSGFQTVYLQQFKQRYSEFTNYIKEYIKTALQTVVSSIVSTGTTTTTSNVVQKYVFTKPFKSGEYAEGVKVLQNLLTTLQLYTGTINGIYDKATKDAVYRFQLSKGLLKGYEKKPDVRGWMGPATRAALNQLTK